MAQHTEMVVISYMMRMMSIKSTKDDKYEVECRYEMLTRNGKEMSKWFSVFGTESPTKEIANLHIKKIKSTLTPKMGKHEYRIKEL